MTTARTSAARCRARAPWARGWGVPLAVVALLAGAVRSEPARGQEASQTSYRVTGTVLAAPGGTPLAFAEVALAGTPRRAFTDGAGRFELSSVPRGEVTLEASRLDFSPARLSLVLVSDTVVTLRLEPRPVPLSAIVVTPGFFGMMSQSLATRQTLTRREIETAPQLGEDIFRAVSRVPGVSTSDISAAFGVRGSRPDEILILLDGLELYEPYHLKDFDNALSILDVGSIGGVDLMTGGFGAQYGDRLGGVFDIRSADPALGPARTQLGLSITALRAGSSGTFAGERGRWLASARRGYLDIAFKLTGADENVSPSYYDVFGKVEYDVGRSTLSWHVLHALDHLTYRGFDNDPRLDTRYGSSYAWMGWRGPLAGPLSGTATLATGRLTWDRTTEPGPGARALPVGVRDLREFHFAALRQDWLLDWSERALTRFGLHLRGLAADYDYEGWRDREEPREGVLHEWRDTTRVLLSPQGGAVDAWLVQRVRVLPSLIAEAGVNWLRREHSGDSEWTPRVNLSLAPTPGTTVRASWGRGAQSQGIHELSAQDGEVDFSPAERAGQRSVGVEHMLHSGATLRAEAYERRMERLRPRWVNPDFPDDMFPELARARVRIDPEEGRARGVELSAARQLLRGWSWSVSYVLAEVSETMEGREAPRARDQRHAVAVDAAWAPNERWRLAGAWVFHSGWPATDVDFRVERLANGRSYVHRVYEPYNGSRFPSYHRLDLRATHRFTTSRGPISVFFDLFNAYDRENPRAVVKSASVDSAGNLRRRQRVERLLPRLPSLGIVWQF